LEERLAPGDLHQLTITPVYLFKNLIYCIIFAFIEGILRITIVTTKITES
jgi:hypothetical protein